MASIYFTHSYIGNLQIDTGIDLASWAYGLNTVSYPTYGGEVVQILSVYIDDLTLTGMVSTYAQLEAIYSYFTAYMIAATQGKKPVPNPSSGSSYNLDPMYFHYPERNWTFKTYLQEAPGFMYDLETAAPQWQAKFQVVDDSPDLSIIKEGIKGAAVANINAGLVGSGAAQSILGNQEIKITGEISPAFGDPNTDPFETFDENAKLEQQDITQYADYYNTLIPSYMQGDFSNLTGVVASQPNFGLKSGNSTPTQTKVHVPAAPKKH
jgi:hypothetical protein